MFFKTKQNNNIMDYTSLFYWLVVADNARDLFLTFVWVFTIISFISTLTFIVGREDMDKGFACPKDGVGERSKKWMWWCYPFMILFWVLLIFTPSKRDSLLIVAGGGTLNFLTTDSTAKQIPHEMSNFVLTELKNMAKDSEVNLNIKDQKNKILEEADRMTPQQVIDKIKSDSTFRKIVLDGK